MDRNTQAAKVRISELFVQWLTRRETETKVDAWCKEATDSSLQPIGARGHGAPLSQHSNNSGAHISGDPYQSSTDSGDDGRAPSPPASPPRQNSLMQNPAMQNRTPSPVGQRFSVDEVDMANARALSPGGASPVSPTAVRVDPALPHPQHHPVNQEAVSPKTPTLNGSNNHPGSPTNSPLSGASALLSMKSLESPLSPSLNNSFNTAAGGRTYSNPGLAGTGLSGSGIPLATLRDIPVFYRPQGATDAIPEELEALSAAFSVKNPRAQSMHVDPSKMLRRAAFAKLCQDVFDVPIVLRDVVFRRVLASSGLPDTGSSASVNYEQVRKYYEVYMAKKTRVRRVFELIRRDNRREHLTLDDLRGCARTFVDFHPGLAFLSQAEFQELYCKTVAIRIVHRWERNRGNVVTWAAFERSDVTDLMMEVDQSQDINSVLCYFTYEHFYVLYCRFWELDQDRDYLIAFEDLQRYNGGSITNTVLRRVVEGYGRRLSSSTQGKLNFEDFVHFCLCEEDKNNPQAVEYWFRIFDLDEDGILSGYEIGEFFQEQQARFLEMGGDELQYDDMLCQMVDMIGASKLEGPHKQGLTLADAKECPTIGTFFNMLMNASKFMGFEHRDPFAEFHQKQMPEKTDWERFARTEYDRMASEAS